MKYSVVMFEQRSTLVKILEQYQNMANLNEMVSTEITRQRKLYLTSDRRMFSNVALKKIIP